MKYITQLDLRSVIITKKHSIVARKISSAFFLIDITDSYANDKCALYEINETGKFIWDHINGERSIREIAVVLHSAIIDDIDFQLIYEDVLEFTKSLLSNDFVEVQYNG